MGITMSVWGEWGKCRAMLPIVPKADAAHMTAHAIDGLSVRPAAG